MENQNDQNQNSGNEAQKPANEENWIERTLDNINKEFPLSGGEKDEDLTIWEEKDPAPEEKEAQQDEVNKKFPLSGGETDADL